MASASPAASQAPATPLSQRLPWRSLGATIPQPLPPASVPGPRSARSRGLGGQTRRTEIFRRTPGTIAWVMVADTQLDKAGQPLVFLDDRDGRARPFSARDDLEQAGRPAQALALQGGASLNTAQAAEGMALAQQQSARSAPPPPRSDC